MIAASLTQRTASLAATTVGRSGACAYFFFASSIQAANAYEAQAVISEMQSGDNVTVQAYVICGP